MSFSKEQTAALTEGTPAQAIAYAGAVCAAFSGPGGALCAAGAASFGPGLALLAKTAKKNGNCVALSYNVAERAVAPTIGTC